MGVFQSTLPARGATTKRRTKLYRGQFQSTLPARGATNGRPLCATVKLISIHAPRTGSDVIFTPNLCNLHPISIHAPRTGSDFTVALDILNRIFQSTLPARGATVSCCKFRWIAKFQSTLPARGATTPLLIISRRDLPFQSTLPARGATRCNHYARNAGKYFNPRSPHGERHRFSKSSQSDFAFQSTLPARGATTPEFDFAIAERISIHAPRTGSDL